MSLRAADSEPAGGVESGQPSRLWISVPGNIICDRALTESLAPLASQQDDRRIEEKDVTNACARTCVCTRIRVCVCARVCVCV